MWRALAAAVALTLLSAGVAAQTTSLAPSKALGCLAPAESERGKPEYPLKLLQRQEGGTVSVELEFDAPDQPPKMRLIDDQVGDALVESVEAFVKRLRVPCMAPEDGQVKLRQQYKFDPVDGRKAVSARSTDPDEPRRAAQLACLRRGEPGRLPDYPIGALDDGQSGRVLVRLRFTRPDSPPAVQVLAAPRRGSFELSVRDYAAGYRLPCQSGGPVELLQLYEFKMSDRADRHLKDMQLLTLLRMAVEVPRPAHFDLDAMRCPFDLRLGYYQPYAENDVAQLDTADTEREPLMRWLAKIALKLPEDLNMAVLGDRATVHVPCGKIDL
jgi:hypothetical protein